ncbi:30S ribosomal protein S15 [Candidatus Burarchaeum australiense]|nr:30S ribosomal protein S15 [Candidatus Burarchaeum australiense]
MPNWVEYSGPEVEELVLKLAGQGLSQAMVGQTLRDTYGVPSVFNVTGKSVTQILTEGGIKHEFPEDLMNLIRRAVRMRKHLKVNSRDVHNTSKLIHVESKIRRLVQYYRESGAIPKKWSYDPDAAALMVK